jgi:hypothetical protein
MPIDFFCHACNAKLRVPDELLGKRTRCIKCKTVNLVLEVVDLPEPALEAAPAEAPPSAVFDDETNAAPLNLTEEPVGPFFDEPRQRPRKRRSGGVSVNTLIIWPAYAIKIGGYIGIVFAVLIMISAVATAIFLGAAGATGPVGGPGAPSAGTAAGGALVGGLLFGAFEMGWSWSLLRCSDAMASRTSYISAVIGCCLSLLPLCPCCVATSIFAQLLQLPTPVGAALMLGGAWFLGPIGVWGLVVLTLPKVRRAFR